MYVRSEVQYLIYKSAVSREGLSFYISREMDEGTKRYWWTQGFLEVQEDKVIETSLEKMRAKKTAALWSFKRREEGKEEYLESCTPAKKYAGEERKLTTRDELLYTPSKRRFSLYKPTAVYLFMDL